MASLFKKVSRRTNKIGRISSYTAQRYFYARAVIKRSMAKAILLKGIRNQRPNCASLLPDTVVHISSMLMGSLKSAIQPLRATS